MFTEFIFFGKLPKGEKGKLDGTAQIKIGTLISFITIAVEIVISLVFTPWMITTIGETNYSVYTIAYSFISIFHITHLV